MSSETRRIRTILDLIKRFPSTAADGHNTSIGLADLDDCAVIPIEEKIDLVFGSDFIRGEGFHLFEQGLLSWKEIGYYLIAANASDLAAMGAIPCGVLVVFRTTSSMSDDDHNQVMEGVAEACSEFGMPLIGGDSGGYVASVLSATAIGTCPHGKALLRQNGRPGDIVYLSDHVGMAAAASAWFLRGGSSVEKLDHVLEQALLSSWKRPQPALKLAALLVKNELSKCAIDTSDGLKAAARQIAEASTLDVVLKSDAIPIAAQTRWVAEKMELPVLALAAGDSVDFRLLFTSPPECQSLLSKILSQSRLPFHPIGELRSTQDVPSVYLDMGMDLVPMPGIEWDQSEKLTIDRLLDGE